MKQSYLAHIRLTTGIALLFACAPVPTAPPVSQAPVESTASAATTAPLAPPPLHPPVLVKVSDGGTVAHRGLYIGLERGYFA